jgi:hypothetical protein
MLDEGTAPPLPTWTDTFFTMETEYAAFQRVIYNLHSAISYAYWNLEPGNLYPVTESVQDQFAAEFEALRAAKQYVGRQWLHASYRSFDIQAEDLVVVTVRETWEDKLYSFQEMPGDGDSPSDPIAGRGPYTLDVTYTLTQQDEQWLITNVVFNNEPPAWTE